MTSPLRDRLRASLTEARKDRDSDLAAGLRSAVAAIENAEAVPSLTAEPSGASVGASTSEHIAGGARGLGAAEAERRVLDAEDERQILRAEAADLRSAAAQYAGLGEAARAESAERVAGVLERLLVD